MNWMCQEFGFTFHCPLLKAYATGMSFASIQYFTHSRHSLAQRTIHSSWGKVSHTAAVRAHIAAHAEVACACNHEARPAVSSAVWHNAAVSKNRRTYSHSTYIPPISIHCPHVFQL